MLYRKKTLTEAAQWFADGHAKPWAQSAVREMGDHFEIDTREGTLRGEPGDWIARGPQGEVYPIGAEIFAQTYEPADQASAARPATAEDVRLMIREEIRASLREERNFASHPDLLAATHCHTGTPQADVQGLDNPAAQNYGRSMANGLAQPPHSWKV